MMGQPESRSLADALASVKGQVADQKRADAEAAQRQAQEEAAQEEQRVARVRDLQAEYNVKFAEITQELRAFEVSTKEMEALLAGEELSDELKSQLDAAVDSNQQTIFALQQEIIDITKQMEAAGAVPEQVEEFEQEIDGIRQEKQAAAERKEQRIQEITKRRSRMEEIDTLIDAHLNAYAAAVEQHGRRYWGKRKDSTIPTYEGELGELYMTNKALQDLEWKINRSLKNLGWFSGKKKQKLEALLPKIQAKKTEIEERIPMVEKAEEAFKKIQDDAFPTDVPVLLDERYTLRLEEEQDRVPEEYVKAGVPPKPPGLRQRHPWAVKTAGGPRNYISDRYHDETVDIPDDSVILPYKKIDIEDLQAEVEAAI